MVFYENEFKEYGLSKNLDLKTIKNYLEVLYNISIFIGEKISEKNLSNLSGLDVIVDKLKKFKNQKSIDKLKPAMNFYIEMITILFKYNLKKSD